MVFDGTGIIGYTSLDKFKGILRIGYKWLEVKNKFNNEIVYHSLFPLEAEYPIP